jgi:hypothetical protein
MSMSLKNYWKDLLNLKKSKEKKYLTICYIKDSMPFTLKERELLLDTLFDYALIFDTHISSYFIAVNIFDRYLSKKDIKRERSLVYMFACYSLAQ